MSMTRILVPVTPGEHSRFSLQSLRSVFNELRADLTLIRILDPFREGGPKPVMQEWQSIQPEHLGVDRIHCDVGIHSDPAAGLARYARDNKMDAIMMPPPLSLFERIFRPALTRRLLAVSPCPVWMSGGQQVQRVLCAVNADDLDVVKSAAALCRQLNARLFLLHVIPDVSEGLLSYGLDNNIALTPAKGMELLAGLQTQAGVSAFPLVETGSPRSAIRRVARSLNIDLVITGRGAYRARKLHWFFTPPVLNAMPCHVVAV